MLVEWLIKLYLIKDIFLALELMILINFITGFNVYNISILLISIIYMASMTKM